MSLPLKPPHFIIYILYLINNLSRAIRPSQAAIKKLYSIGNANMPWKILQPNEHGDWIVQRNDAFTNYIPIDTENKFQLNTESYFVTYSRGTASSGDAWVYNFSKKYLSENVQKTIAHYNQQRKLINSGKLAEPERDSTKGNWTRDWLNQLGKNKEFRVVEEEYRNSMYRPFTRMHHYFDDDLNQERYLIPRLFPTLNEKNVVICVSGVGVTKDFSTMITDTLPDLELIGKSQCFPLYYYELREKTAKGLFDEDGDSEYIRHDGVSDFILERAQKQYGKAVTKEDIFYYVYGFLHCPEYCKIFTNDLKKMLPRLPLVEDAKDFWSFSKAGRKLAELHLNYESVDPAPDVKVVLPEIKYQMDAYEFYEVEKMRFPKKDQKDTIIYNSRITVKNIPAEAYDYVVNGKSAIEWIMERYQISIHKDSGIKNDPNDWSREVEKPSYILDLLLSVINVSLQTNKIVNNLPIVKFE